MIGFPRMKVAKILDATTLVLTGDNLDTVREGEELIVLSIGPKMEEAGGAPLVGEKARVTVTLNAGEYVVARPPEQKVEVRTGGGFYFDQLAATGVFGKPGTKTIVQRPPLPVAEAQMTGNPATRTIVLGDPVIRFGDLRDYVRLLKESQPAA